MICNHQLAVRFCYGAPYQRGSSSIGRALAFQARCCEFETRLPLQLNLNMKLPKHNLDIERCVSNIGNKFDLILVAAYRTRELAKKNAVSDHKHTVTALMEIERGDIGREMLRRVRTR